MGLRDKIEDFINENLTIINDGIIFNDDDNIFELGYVNSLFAIKLLNFIENEFAITVENDEMDISNFSSISNIVSYISKKHKSV